MFSQRPPGRMEDLLICLEMDGVMLNFRWQTGLSNFVLLSSLLTGSFAFSQVQVPGNQVASTSEGPVEAQDVKIAPPPGWEFRRNYLGKTLVMQPATNPDAKPAKVEYGKATYTRNITVAVAHEARPVDEQQAVELQHKLEEEFGKAAGVTDFQILEHRLIDYRKKSDGILVYTSFLYGGFPMSQMHIFVSGDKDSALLTYTDLTEDFQKNEAALNGAWASMLSVELNGEPPVRYRELVEVGIGVGVVLILLAGAILLRRRANRKMFADAEAGIYDSDPTSDVSSFALFGGSSVGTQMGTPKTAMSHVWNLQTTRVSEIFDLQPAKRMPDFTMMTQI